MDYIIKITMPDELLNQAERAAASLGLSADTYLRIALEEKLRRRSEDEDRQLMVDAQMECLLKKRGELYRQVAQWPEAGAEETNPKNGEGD
jgi:hypothetical protein